MSLFLSPRDACQRLAWQACRPPSWAKRGRIQDPQETAEQKGGVLDTQELPLLVVLGPAFSPSWTSRSGNFQAHPPRTLLAAHKRANEAEANEQHGPDARLGNRRDG